MRSSTLLLVLGIASSAAVGLGFVAYEYLPASPVVRGLHIADRRVPDEGSAATWLADRQKAALDWEVRFHHGGEIIAATLGQVGVELDVHRSLERASEIGHTGSFSRRMREASAARRGEIDVPLVFFVDERKARAFFEGIAPLFARAPVDARLDLAQKQKTPDEPGRELDVEASLAALKEAALEDGVVVPLVTRRVPAKVTLVDLVAVDVSKVVSSFETSFSLAGSGKGRAVNIRNAASKIDGIVIPPGGVFSFNDKVGPRTIDNGFTLAPEIQGDELTDGVGGGTCQLSSTLHGAAVFGALEVIQRRNHSRASSYTKLGLDAAVSYPIVDLKLKNSLPYPVMIHVTFPAATKVRVEVLGGDPVAKVEYGYGVAERMDFVRRITVKEDLPPGKRIHRQKGVQGFNVFSTLRLTYNDGRVEERRYFSAYRPSPEVYWVAPDYDESNLPPLPEHAKGVEGRPSPEEAADETASYPM
ncbi:VanW family protein [Polyangium aurulentum]|uniref:VanW family protein n=1 Tax=Polyangium aurulentum TaxID=2567896 RepID=UPI0010AE1F32|nr:VanW family protein [Polyangium aurulentum]UQA55304.1 VanW family protein [Polyangium aurulentum]